jgi:hypothetical protein
VGETGLKRHVLVENVGSPTGLVGDRRVRADGRRRDRKAAQRRGCARIDEPIARPSRLVDNRPAGEVAGLKSRRWSRLPPSRPQEQSRRARSHREDGNQQAGSHWAPLSAESSALCCVAYSRRGCESISSAPFHTFGTGSFEIGFQQRPESCPRSRSRRTKSTSSCDIVYSRSPAASRAPAGCA